VTIDLINEQSAGKLPQATCFELFGPSQASQFRPNERSPMLHEEPKTFKSVYQSSFWVDGDILLGHNAFSLPTVCAWRNVVINTNPIG
jgi:hypothetical protein